MNANDGASLSSREEAPISRPRRQVDKAERCHLVYTTRPILYDCKSKRVRLIPSTPPKLSVEVAMRLLQHLPQMADLLAWRAGETVKPQRKKHRQAVQVVTKRGSGDPVQRRGTQPARVPRAGRARTGPAAAGGSTEGTARRWDRPSAGSSLPPFHPLRNLVTVSNSAHLEMSEKNAHSTPWISCMPARLLLTSCSSASLTFRTSERARAALRKGVVRSSVRGLQ